jgi:hypothetical protein
MGAGGGLWIAAWDPLTFHADYISNTNECGYVEPAEVRLFVGEWIFAVQSEPGSGDKRSRTHRAFHTGSVPSSKQSARSRGAKQAMRGSLQPLLPLLYAFPIPCALPDYAFSHGLKFCPRGGPYSSEAAPGRGNECRRRSEAEANTKRSRRFHMIPPSARAATAMLQS